MLLIGTYELRHCVEVPYRVAINEAVELAKGLRRHRRPQVCQRRARQGRRRAASGRGRRPACRPQRTAPVLIRPPAAETRHRSWTDSPAPPRSVRLAPRVAGIEPFWVMECAPTRSHAARPAIRPRRRADDLPEHRRARRHRPRRWPRRRGTASTPVAPSTPGDRPAGPARGDLALVCRALAGGCAGAAHRRDRRRVGGAATADHRGGGRRRRS